MHDHSLFHFLLNEKFSNQFDRLHILIVSVVNSGIFMDDPSSDRIPVYTQAQERFSVANDQTKGNAFVNQMKNDLFNS